MAELKKRTAILSEFDTGEVVIEAGLIQASTKARDLGFVATGFADRIQEVVEIDECKVGYVDMNRSGRADIGTGHEGIVATSALAGCTGVAGYSRQKDGSIKAFVSHYDALSQTYQLTRESSPANNDVWRFRHDTLTADPADDTLFLIAYPNSSTSDPNYGTRRGPHEEWHYLDQLETTAEYLGNTTKVLMLPYKEANGHTLASGRIEGVEGIFWDGIPIDFESALAAESGTQAK